MKAEPMKIKLGSHELDFAHFDAAYDAEDGGCWLKATKGWPFFGAVMGFTPEQAEIIRKALGVTELPEKPNKI